MAYSGTALLLYVHCNSEVSEVAQSVLCVTTDWTNGVRSPSEAKDFSSSLSTQTGSEAHPASCPMGTVCPFPGAKARPGRDADHSPHLVQRSRISRSYTSSPPCVSIGVLWDCFTFIYTVFATELLIAYVCLYTYVQMHMYTSEPHIHSKVALHMDLTEHKTNLISHSRWVANILKICVDCLLTKILFKKVSFK
jgi:hypothetical protein